MWYDWGSPLSLIEGMRKKLERKWGCRGTHIILSLCRTSVGRWAGQWKALCPRFPQLGAASACRSFLCPPSRSNCLMLSNGVYSQIYFSFTCFHSCSAWIHLCLKQARTWKHVLTLQRYSQLPVGLWRLQSIFAPHYRLPPMIGWDKLLLKPFSSSGVLWLQSVSSENALETEMALLDITYNRWAFFICR